ncbi:hypothetical protein N9E25_07600 [Verrucomicrobiales bacterium]|nr:hypothetical protein [Verrucomicrobiales bacterium]
MSDPTWFSEENDDKIRVDPVRLARKRYVLAEARRLLRERLGEPEWASANDDDARKKNSSAGHR